MPHDTRDQIVDYVRRWSEKTEIGVGRFIPWLGIRPSKFYDWRERYGKVNEHNGWIPRDFWLQDWEKQAIINFHLKNPLEGYRRLTFMMLERRHRRSEPLQRVARITASGAAVEMERTTVQEKAPASSSRYSRINTGISIFPTSTSAARFIICAAF